MAVKLEDRVSKLTVEQVDLHEQFIDLKGDFLDQREDIIEIKKSIATIVQTSKDSRSSLAWLKWTTPAIVAICGLGSAIIHFWEHFK